MCQAPSICLDRAGLCQPACWHTCLQSLGQALKDCPKFYEKAGSSSWTGFSLCSSTGGLAGMEKDAWGHAPSVWALCAERELFLLFAVKLCC